MVNFADVQNVENTKEVVLGVIEKMNKRGNLLNQIPSFFVIFVLLP